MSQPLESLHIYWENSMQCNSVHVCAEVSSSELNGKCSYVSGNRNVAFISLLAPFACLLVSGSCANCQNRLFLSVKKNFLKRKINCWTNVWTNSCRHLRKQHKRKTVSEAQETIGTKFITTVCVLWGGKAEGSSRHPAAKQKSTPTPVSVYVFVQFKRSHITNFQPAHMHFAW